MIQYKEYYEFGVYHQDFKIFNWTKQAYNNGDTYPMLGVYIKLSFQDKEWCVRGRQFKNENASCEETVAGLQLMSANSCLRG
jgi:hypothetical protein